MPGLVPLPRDEDGAIVGEVLWVDRYGNCQLNVDPEAIDGLGRAGAAPLDPAPRGRAHRRRAATYGELGPGQVGLVVDSYGLLAVSVARGRPPTPSGSRPATSCRWPRSVTAPTIPGPTIAPRASAATAPAPPRPSPSSPESPHETRHHHRPRHPARPDPGGVGHPAAVCSLIGPAELRRAAAASCKTLARMNLAPLIEDHDADRPALVSRGQVTTYGKLRDQVARARGGLRRPGHRARRPGGDRAANNWRLRGRATWPCWAWAPSPCRSTRRARRPSSSRAGAATGVRLALVGPAGRAAVDGRSTPARSPGYDGGVAVADLLDAEPAPRSSTRADDDLAVLLFTSGTAGAPRPAMLTHGNLSGQRRPDPRQPRTARREPTRWRCACCPLFHVFGLNAVLGVTLRVGGAVVLVERFDPHSTLDAVAEHGVTVLSGVPTMWAAWAALPDATPDAMATVRLAVSGAAALDPGRAAGGAASASAST